MDSGPFDTGWANCAKPLSGLKDSGQRKQYEGGGLRERARMSRFDLLPVPPLERWAEHLGRGALKYADRNWEQGLPLDDFIDSALSHLLSFMSGDREEDHLAAVLWNIGAYITIEEKVLNGKQKALGNHSFLDQAGRSKPFYGDRGSEAETTSGLPSAQSE